MPAALISRVTGSNQTKEMKMKTLNTIFAIATLTLAAQSALAEKATAKADINLSAEVKVRAKLTLGVSSISFQDADPSAMPSISANENGSISVVSWVRTPTGTKPLLTVEAKDDLKSGTDKIDAHNVSWTASGDSAYKSGTLSKSSQTVAEFPKSGKYEGAYNFQLKNSAEYAPGSYTTQVTYTLVVP